MASKLLLLALLLVPVLRATQYALPTSNSFTGWSEGAGDGDSDFFDELDEGFGAGRGSGSGPDDATSYWTSITAPIDEVIRTGLSTVTDPATGTGHIYRTRSRKTLSSGQQIDVTIEIKFDLVAFSTTFTNIDATWTDRGNTLTGTEADTIVTYVGASLETSTSKVGGGTPRSADESAHEFEVPDAAGGTRQRGHIAD